MTDDKAPSIRGEGKEVTDEPKAPVSPELKIIPLPLAIIRKRITWLLIAILGVLLLGALFLFSYLYNASSTPRFDVPSQARPNAFIRSIYRGGTVDLNHPSDVATSPEGELYVADTNNQRIAVFSHTGEFLRAFGNSTPTATSQEQTAAAQTLVSPTSIAVSDTDRVYVIDSARQRLLIYDTTGAFLKEVAFDEEAPLGVTYAAAATAGKGRVVVTTKSGFAIGDADGNFTFADMNWGSKPAQFDNPTEALLTFSQDATGTLYVCDSLNYRIQALTTIDTSPTPSWTYGTPLPTQDALQYQETDRKFGLPVSMALVSNNELFVVDGLSSEVIVLNAKTGAYLRTIASVGGEDGQLYYPAGIATANNELYVADKYNDRIEVFSTKATAAVPPQSRPTHFDPLWLSLIPLLLILVALVRQFFIRMPRCVLDLELLEVIKDDEAASDFLVDLRRVSIPLEIEPMARAVLPLKLAVDIELPNEQEADAFKAEHPALDEFEAAAYLAATHLGRRGILLTASDSLEEVARENGQRYATAATFIECAHQHVVASENGATSSTSEDEETGGAQEEK